MELVVGENTYITVTECASLIRDYFGSGSTNYSTFNGLSTNAKESCVYRSFLDMERLQYRGKKKAEGQVLSFPRVNRLGYESRQDVVKLAQALNSLAFAQESVDGSDSSVDNILKLGNYGVTSYKLGSFAVKIDGQKVEEASSQKSKSGYVEEILPTWLKGGFHIR